MTRVFVLVLDSLGVGALPDAGTFGDTGCHTLDHIVKAAGRPDIPRLEALGVGCIEGVSGIPAQPAPAGWFGRMAEQSPGKDTLTGHWEMMGCPLDSPFPVFPDGFPAEIIDELVSRAELPGVLCNRPASGTEVIELHGPEHVEGGKPIVYTSADSVLQIAAHEQHFGLERLYQVSRMAREIVRPHGVARVIARPFVGSPGGFERTYNRRDYSLEPPRETVLDRLVAAGIPVTGIGKIEDIFAGRGVTHSLHSEGNRDGMRLLIEASKQGEDGFYFLNLVDFDMLFGHRRDPIGYRRALEEFDRDLIEFDRTLRPGDLVLLTADHGNDPTHEAGTDHTREYVPVIAYGPGLERGVDLGTRSSFADLGATVEEAFGLHPVGGGRPFGIGPITNPAGQAPIL